jgi:hypothetical protein
MMTTTNDKNVLESLFLSLVKKDIASAKKFIKFAQNVVADERSRREQMTHDFYVKITDSNERLMKWDHYMIREAIFDETRYHLVDASNSNDVLTCLKEIADHLFRLDYIYNDEKSDVLPPEFQVLFDSGANCADFLSEEERNGITQSIKEYVSNKRKTS